jgi:hypothetical protein
MEKRFDQERLRFNNQISVREFIFLKRFKLNVELKNEKRANKKN